MMSAEAQRQYDLKMGWAVQCLDPLTLFKIYDPCQDFYWSEAVERVRRFNELVDEAIAIREGVKG